jgi:EAL domain-containing protein (putative c-di-GMP-specific phosphodiesterase class I)
MSDMDKVLPVLKRLRDAGVGLSLDDFGTGYSSLSYLRQMPITTLKMDRSFISDVPGKSDACSIATAIIAVGQQLGITVVAEGVETAEQRDFLLQYNCDQAQGWLFYKALSPTRAEKLLRGQV